MKTKHVDVYAFVGGRKFIISILGMMSLVLMASYNPMAVTTEVVLGIIGIVATFSGSNSLVTAIMAKVKPSAAASGELNESMPSYGQPVISDSPVVAQPGVVSELEARVQALENTMNEVIGILKVQNETLNRLTIAQNQANLGKNGQQA